MSTHRFIRKCLNKGVRISSCFISAQVAPYSKTTSKSLRRLTPIRSDITSIIGTLGAVGAVAGAYRFFTDSSTSSDFSVKDYKPNGPVAQRIASVTPYFPFKGIERFYDIGGFLKDPEAFQLVIDVFVERYKSRNIDCVVGIDARGFVLGPPIALALKVPFVMLRKKGKMPNSITGKHYSKEYAGNDSLSIPRGSLQKGDRVLLIDDLVATGGTLVAGLDLIKGMDATVVECACVVEIKALNAKAKFEENGHSDVTIWALMDESILTLDGLKDESIDTTDFIDDGEAH
jgi:adenine phosphoribosyltransferase